ncbi:MAG: hypothetical protein ABSF98_04770 [Bryobacteraceae bacterium]|jgi:hypothetical protein
MNKKFIELEGSVINIGAIAMIRLQADGQWIVRMIDGVGYSFSAESISKLKAYLAEETTTL